MNRHQRRALAKTGLAQTAGKLEEALGSIQAMGTVAPQLQEVERVVQEAHQMVTLLVEDVQTLSDEVDLLRKVILSDTTMAERFEVLQAAVVGPIPKPKPSRE